LSPLIWNIVVDRLLTVTNDLGFSTFGYADNIVIIVQGKFAHTFREIMQEALNVVVRWTVNEGLNISPHKTVIVPFTNRRRIEGLGPLKLHGKQLQMLDGVKYLGVTLDSKLSWNQHLQKIIRKVQTIFAVLRRTWKKSGVSDLIWCIGSILELSDHPYFMAPWYGGPRSGKKLLKFN
jgi:hypothetical protein